MSDEDRDVLIMDSKVVQARIDAKLREKALQATAKEVSLGQLGIRQGLVSEANSEAIDGLLQCKGGITSALSFVEEVRKIQDKFNHVEPEHEVWKLCKCLRRASRSLSSVSLANAGIKYASMATVDCTPSRHKPSEWGPAPALSNLISWPKMPTPSPSVPGAFSGKAYVLS